MKTAMKALAISAVLLMVAPATFAQSPEASTLPVTEPLDVGGTILQPGTYLIRVVSPRADRNKVQITSMDRQTVYATVLTIPHELEPNEEVPSTTFVYFPAGEGQPRALRTWFAPDPASGGGHDIVYDEARARQLARLANEPVPSFHDEQVTVIRPEVTTTETTPVAVTPVQPAPVVERETTIETTTETVTPAPTPTPTPMTSAAVEDTEVAMPQTASRVPLMALLGLMALVSAVVVRAARA
ncbi:MAG: hypothetical protein ACLGH0_15465 [Thermoanaerobaculia bacterium]